MSFKCTSFYKELVEGDRGSMERVKLLFITILFIMIMIMTIILFIMIMIVTIYLYIRIIIIAIHLFIMNMIAMISLYSLFQKILIIGPFPILYIFKTINKIL